jgi:hypothetical protein
MAGNFPAIDFSMAFCASAGPPQKNPCCKPLVKN